MRMHEILVTSDLSPAAEAAFAHAACLARPYNAHLTLLNVDELLEFGFHSAAEFGEYLDGVAKIREERLQLARERFATLDVEVDVETADGSAWKQILAVADRLDASLIALTKQGARDLAHWLMGSTTRRVIRHAKRPTLIVPPGAPTPTRYKKLIVATDLSEDSERGLRASLGLARDLDAELLLTHVLRLPMLVPTIPGESMLIVPDKLKGQLRQDADLKLREQVERIADPRLRWQLLINHGIAEALVSSADDEDADVIIIPSHGKGAWSATFLGSTTEAVLKLATRPVLVLPRDYLTMHYAI